MIARVTEFAVKRNEAESYCQSQSDAQDQAWPEFSSDKEKFAWLREHPPVNWFDRFAQLLVPLFEEYCTDKRRVYGGTNPGTFGSPPKFFGIEHPAEMGVELKNRNRAEVYIKTETQFKDEYLFIVLRKAGIWKIDSYKWRLCGDEKWENRIL